MRRGMKMTLLEFRALWWLVLLCTPATGNGQNGWKCPRQCICLSSTQVLCNGGGLTSVPDDIPAGVEHLSLVKNDIGELKSDAFRQYKQLRKLYLDGNSIRIVRQFAFRGLSKLQELSLQNTPLDRLAQFTFSGLYNLTNLYLGKNQIRRIEGYAFAGTSSLRLLVLTDNPTIRIDTSAFSGLSDVQMLYLPAGIKHLEADAFNGLSNVGHLKIIHMDLSGLNNFAFRGLRNVQLLSIQESNLGTIRRDAFINMTGVAKLALLNNKIDTIDQFRITTHNRVQTLQFIGNHLLDIPPSDSFQLSGVPDKLVVENYFMCDCRIHWLLFSSLLDNGSNLVEFMATNYCILPLEANGQTILQATNNTLASVPCPATREREALNDLSSGQQSVTEALPTLAGSPALAGARRLLVLGALAVAYLNQCTRKS